MLSFNLRVKSSSSCLHGVVNGGGWRGGRRGEEERREKKEEKRPSLHAATGLMVTQANKSKLPVDTPKLVSLVTHLLYTSCYSFAMRLVIRQATYDSNVQRGG